MKLVVYNQYACREIGQCWRATRAPSRFYKADGEARNMRLSPFISLKNISDKLRGLGQRPKVLLKIIQAIIAIVNLCRRKVFQRLMRSIRIILIQIPCKPLAGFSGAFIVIQVYFLIFYRSP